MCLGVFAGTLDVHPSRLDYIRKKKDTSTGIVSPDKRGRKTPGNVVSRAKIIALQNFFKLFPKFVSHYSNNNKQYFSPDLTKTKLFNLYKAEHKENSVSYTVFIKEFRKLNISIYKPKADTCSKCDEFKASGSKDDKSEEHQDHLQRASDARKYLHTIEKLGKARDDTLVISFDMQKTQPMPYIQTSVAFYKRQLWMYNLGINNRATNKGTMCLWTEVQGKRGSNEVGSAILEYLRSIDLTNIKEIYSFSDGCGGQNKNRTIASLFMNICRNTPVEQWTHSYLESGHSYLPNDVDFGKIERKKKYRQNIYESIAWEELVSECNFAIIKMEGKIKEISTLCQNHHFRSVNTRNEKFSWLKMKWFRVNGDNSFIEYKNSCSETEEIKIVDFTSKSDIYNDIDAFDLPNMYINNPPKISKAKFDDIQSLMPFVPPIHHSFFQNLPHVTNRDDEIENLDNLI